MGGDAANTNVDGVGAGIHQAVVQDDLACWIFGDHVQGQGKIRPANLIVQAIRHHGPGASKCLLCWLTHQVERTRPVILPGGELPCRPDQGGHVHVVPAGVHDRHVDALQVDLALFGGIAQSGLLLHGQAVHVRPDQQAGSGAIAHRGHQPRAPNAPGDFKAQ